MVSHHMQTCTSTPYPDLCITTSTSHTPNMRIECYMHLSWWPVCNDNISTGRRYLPPPDTNNRSWIELWPSHSSWRRAGLIELTEKPADDVIGSSSKSTQRPEPDVCPLDSICSTQDIRESCDSTDQASITYTDCHIPRWRSEPWVQCLLSVAWRRKQLPLSELDHLD